MRRLAIALLLPVAAALSAASAAAQSPVSVAVEARAAYAAAIGQWAGKARGFGSGPGYGANAQLTVGRFGVYGGWETHHFSVDASRFASGLTAGADDAGFRFGALATLPAAPRRMAPYLLAGVVHDRLSVNVGTGLGDLGFDTDAAYGWEAGAGAAIPLGRLAVTPSLRYRTHAVALGALREFFDETGRVNYLLLDVGVRLPLTR